MHGYEALYLLCEIPSPWISGSGHMGRANMATVNIIKILRIVIMFIISFLIVKFVAHGIGCETFYFKRGDIYAYIVKMYNCLSHLRHSGNLLPLSVSNFTFLS